MKLFKNFGILGINARNLLYIRPFNSKKAVKMADSKLKTKQFLSVRDVPVPKLFAVIRSEDELSKFDFSTLPSAFVLKPNLGFGGEGIIPFIGKKNDFFEKSSGVLMTLDELKEHIGDILEGRFSMSGVPDTAFFEQLIVCDDRISKFAYKGLPDIRVVVHNLIPVMAMLRLPTKESDGKANLHLGAVGVGIDISNGTATHTVYKNKIVNEVPGAGPIAGLKIPYWDQILRISSNVQMATNLGYMAVDIAIDRNIGPVLLEINARAGLGVQIANLAPLRKRLERIQGIKVGSPEKGVRIAQDMFGNKVEKEVKKISGKEIIGSREKITILDKDGKRIVWASINPLLEKTLIDRDLVKDLGLDAGLKNVKIKFSLAEQRIQTLAQVEDLSGKPFEVVVGKRDLQGFLIDPSKGRSGIAKLTGLEKISKTLDADDSPNYLEIDKSLISIDRQTKLLNHLRPRNYEEEREKFLDNYDYNPQFIYSDLQFDPLHLKEKLKKIEDKCDDSALGKLYINKISEFYKKIEMLECISTENFTSKSAALYGIPDEGIIYSAKQKLKSMPDSFADTGKTLTDDEIVSRLTEILQQYHLKNWQVILKKDMIADCSAGKESTLFVREHSAFTEDRLRMIIAHEIETHILTAENGKKQNFGMFNRGFGFYLETQEGLAIWNQEHVLNHDMNKNYRAAMLVLIVKFAENNSFSQTAKYCLDLGMSPLKAFRTCSKVKRGLEDTSQSGVFTKDAIYFRGYLQIQNFIALGGDLKDLYYGKYNLRDLDLIKSVLNSDKSIILPTFLI